MHACSQLWSCPRDLTSLRSSEQEAVVNRDVVVDLQTKTELSCMHRNVILRRRLHTKHALFASSVYSH